MLLHLVSLLYWVSHFYCYTKFRHAEMGYTIPSAIMLCVTMLSVFMLSVVMLSVVILNVVAPNK
jgi:hypothetical protein